MAEPTEVERLRDQLISDLAAFAAKGRRYDICTAKVDALIAVVRAEALAELMPWEMDDLAEPFRHSEQYSDQVADQAIAAYRRLRGAK